MQKGIVLYKFTNNWKHIPISHWNRSSRGII